MAFKKNAAGSTSIPVPVQDDGNCIPAVEQEHRARLLAGKGSCQHFPFLASYVEEAKFQVNTAEKLGAFFFKLPLTHRAEALTPNTGTDR